jgi:hypothetical protein
MASDVTSEVLIGLIIYSHSETGNGRHQPGPVLFFEVIRLVIENGLNPVFLKNALHGQIYSGIVNIVCKRMLRLRISFAVCLCSLSIEIGTCASCNFPQVLGSPDRARISFCSEPLSPVCCLLARRIIYNSRIVSLYNSYWSLSSKRVLTVRNRLTSKDQQIIRWPQRKESEERAIIQIPPQEGGICHPGNQFLRPWNQNQSILVRGPTQSVGDVR